MAVLFFGLVSGLAFGQAGGFVPSCAQFILPAPSTIFMISAGTTFFTFLKKKRIK